MSTKTPKQPIKQRIKDIALWGTLMLGSSFLYGNLEIFKITGPLFLILSCIISTGRYKKSQGYDPSYAERERQRRIFSGCGNLSTRESLLGY